METGFRTLSLYYIHAESTYKATHGRTYTDAHTRTQTQVPTLYHTHSFLTMSMTDTGYGISYTTTLLVHYNLCVLYIMQQRAKC